MGKNFLTIVYIAMMGMVAFTACGNKENKEEAIGKSMAENLPGKWTITKSYEKKDGEWKEVIEPEGSGTTYLFRTDGSMMSAVTYANHDTYLRSIGLPMKVFVWTIAMRSMLYPVRQELVS